MKKLVFLLTITTSVAFVNAQKLQTKDVPTSVREAFHKQFSTIKEVKWEKEHGNYEAGFKLEKTDYSVIVDASGNILETEMSIDVKSLSAPIIAYIAKNYPNQKIKEAAKITDAKGIVTYEAEVNGKDLIFDNNGKFLKETKD